MSITLLIIIVTVVVSLAAFNNPALMNNLLFYPYQIWRRNEWHRLLSCGFIHADMGHLFFNLFALYGFGEYIEGAFGYTFGAKGTVLFVVMYFGAIATADILNLFQQKDNPQYRSLGASGGVSAVIFSFILFNPFGKIYLFFIPIGIPAFAFGGIYLAYCVYMAKRGGDNIGHIAHFTGSIFGFVFPILFEPRLLSYFIAQLKQGI